MGCLGATLTQVFTRTCGADVSLSDVTIAQMGNGATECKWHYAPEARRGFWGFWKSLLVELSPDSEEDGWLSLARRSQVSGLCGGCRTRSGGGNRWKGHNRKNVYLSPYVETFNSKVIKGFVPELRSRKCFSWFLCSMYICYEYLCTFCISVSGCGTFSVARHVGCSKPGSKSIQLYVRPSLRPLDQQAYHVG